MSDWLDQYKPIENNYDPDSSFNGTLFGVRGDEFDLVRSVAKNNAWTLVEVEGEFYIENGMRLVDRVGYFITEKPFTDSDESELLIEVNE